METWSVTMQEVVWHPYTESKYEVVVILILISFYFIYLFIYLIHCGLCTQENSTAAHRVSSIFFKKSLDLTLFNFLYFMDKTKLPPTLPHLYLSMGAIVIASEKNSERAPDWDS